MDEARKASYAKTAAIIIGGLAKRNIEGIYCETGEEARELVRDMIPEGSTVTWGGSRTLDEVGVRTMLKEGAYRVVPSEETKDDPRAAWLERAGADYFLMSTNAITRDGALVNIDGNSNRLSLLLHGPQHVIIIAGMNKATADVDSAFKRIRTTTCPMNAADLHPGTPCDHVGVCGDCHVPKSMCCQLVVTRHSRHDGRIKVVLVGEELGH